MARSGDANIALTAALIGDPTRGHLLMALLDGRSLPASLLAAEAGVIASTISEHLARLVKAGLLTAERQVGLDLDDVERHRPRCATAWIGPNNATI
jgi:DNA-binding transcriptional ArsR family regulator